MARKQSAAVEKALNVIAHVVMSAQLEAKVKGMKGFHDHYLRNMSAVDKAIYARFQEIGKEAFAELARLTKEDAKAGQ